MDGHFVTSKDLVGVVDAFTGEALNAALGLYQCGNCRVYYHSASFDVIRIENGGKCVACPSVSIRVVSLSQTRTDSRPTTGPKPRETSQAVNYRPDTVALSNYREHVGRVVTFTGTVFKVIKSRNGKNYAAMFEDKDWCDGFKVVVFRGKITAAGGGDFLRSLASRRISVRGLLQKHPIFGYQIVVSERMMILTIA